MTHFPARLLTLMVPPATEPVTTAEAKLYLRVDNTDEDLLVADMVMAARIAAEEYLGQSFIDQTWKLTFNQHIPGCVFLPRGPVDNVISVMSYDKDEVLTTIGSSVYKLNASKEILEFESTIFGERIEIIYSTGYGDASQVPKVIKQGILSHVASMFDQRDSAGALPAAAVALYASFRKVRI